MAGVNLTAMVTGRIVYTVGDLFAGTVAKQYGTQHPKLNKQGQQYKEYGFGLAVSKQQFEEHGMDLWNRMHEAAYSIFPNRQIPPAFKMKFKDGDTGTNQDGTVLNTREGYPGHLVFNLKTTFPIKFFKLEGGQNFQVNEGVKCGDYVRVQVSISVNPGTNAGLYLNPLAVQLIQSGKEIVNTPSAEAIFGSVMPNIANAVAPVAPTGFIIPTQTQVSPAAPTPQVQQGYAPAGQPTPMTQATPHYGILPQVHQPAPSPQAGPPMPGFPPSFNR